ncbi:hypothetical protein GCM10009804_06280 [Kribbella hippodromi]|uniref:Uncharacterized protein n=1 Tax=Kribbella hippodromi TaxID=434347 RepID=A0ABN2C4T1_9ACTN
MVGSSRVLAVVGTRRVCRLVGLVTPHRLVSRAPMLAGLGRRLLVGHRTLVGQAVVVGRAVLVGLGSPRRAVGQALALVG